MRKRRGQLHGSQEGLSIGADNRVMLHLNNVVNFQRCRRSSSRNNSFLVNTERKPQGLNVKSSGVQSLPCALARPQETRKQRKTPAGIINEPLT